MTVNRGLFVRNNGTVGTTPIQGRLVLASLVAENAPGTPRNGLLDPKTTNVVTGKADMSYDVSAITAVVNRAAGEGVYLFTTTGTTNVATTAAPGTGSRYDLIYVLQRDIDKGDSDNVAVLAVYQGTAATSPTKPYASLPAGALVLAEALVASGATATNGAGVTITQVWRYAALRNAAIPVRNTTERDEITTPTLGVRVARLDRAADGSVVEIYTGSAWELLGPREMVFVNGGFQWGANAAWDAGTLSLNTGTGPSSQFTSPQPTFATNGSLSGTIKFTEPGIYAVTWMVGPGSEPGNAGYRVQTSGTWPGNPASAGDTVFGQGIHINGQTYWETFVSAPFIRVPQANLEVRLSGIQINSTNNTALVRVIQLAKL